MKFNSTNSAGQISHFLRLDPMSKKNQMIITTPPTVSSATLVLRHQGPSLGVMRRIVVISALGALLVCCSAVPTTRSDESVDAQNKPLVHSAHPPQVGAESLTHSIVRAGASAAAAVHGTASEWATGIHKWMAPWSQKASAGDVCSDGDWRKTSLKLIRHLPIAGLFKDLKGTVKWEASGVDVVNGNQVTWPAGACKLTFCMRRLPALAFLVFAHHAAIDRGRACSVSGSPYNMLMVWNTFATQVPQWPDMFTV